MDYIDSVMEFLAKEDNFETALDIAKAMERLKSKLHEDFWIDIDVAMATRLASSKHLEYWEVETTALQDPFKAYVESRLLPRAPHRGLRYLGFSLMQDRPTKDFHLYFGVGWGERLTEHLGVEAISQLSNDLKREGFSANDWWLGWRHIDFYPSRKDFLVSVISDQQSLVNEILDPLWALFTEKREIAESINKSLKAE